MKPTVYFIHLVGRPKLNRRCFLIPLIPDEKGNIPPYTIHCPRITAYYSRDHFETADTIWRHYEGDTDPFINNPTCPS